MDYQWGQQLGAGMKNCQEQSFGIDNEFEVTAETWPSHIDKSDSIQKRKRQ